MLDAPIISRLGQDPDRSDRINANSFQQHSITTVQGWQYAALYIQNATPGKSNVATIALVRRRVDRPLTKELSQNSWEMLTFEDYEQTVDDGHNTISIGICEGDGTIHLSFDHHCDPLRYRVSKPGIASHPEGCLWDSSSFSEIQNSLPGMRPDAFNEVTYPVFVNIGDDLLFSFRVGRAGQGSDVLYHYSSQTHQYSYLGQHLTGVASSPYTNGLDYRLGRLHVSWCYRAFIEYEGSHDSNSTAHKVPAGPNGPENNHGLYYMYSDDCGLSWSGNDGKVIAVLDDKDGANTVLPSTSNITAFDIPQNSGILNSEGQTVDWEGGFHVLNRENTSGESAWMHYYRHQNGTWKRTPISTRSSPTNTGARGSVCVDRQNNLYAILPGNLDSSLTILRSSPEDGYEKFHIIWTGDGFDGEPLFDVQRLEMSNILSVFTRTDKAHDGKREVVVLDWDLGFEAAKA